MSVIDFKKEPSPPEISNLVFPFSPAQRLSRVESRSRLKVFPFPFPPPLFENRKFSKRQSRVNESSAVVANHRENQRPRPSVTRNVRPAAATEIEQAVPQLTLHLSIYIVNGVTFYRKGQFSGRRGSAVPIDRRRNKRENNEAAGRAQSISKPGRVAKGAGRGGGGGIQTARVRGFSREYNNRVVDPSRGKRKIKRA